MRNNDDPLWRSTAVRAGLLWLGAALASGVGAVALQTCEQGRANAARLDVVAVEIVGLRRDFDIFFQKNSNNSVNDLPVTARKSHE